jgi:hypothetical protein
MLVGHHSTTVTETVYRKQLQPVIEGGADWAFSATPDMSPKVIPYVSRAIPTALYRAAGGRFCRFVLDRSLACGDDRWHSESLSPSAVAGDLGRTGPRYR